MNGSAFYYPDGISDWNPEHLRHHLFISEDQLKILSNLPAWSQINCEADGGLIKGIDSTVFNSQVSQLESQVISSKRTENQCSNEKNIELFNKGIEERRAILLSEVSQRKRNKSSSLIETLKPNQKFPKATILRSAKSTFNLTANCLLSKQLYLEPLNHIKKVWKTFTFPNHSEIRSKELFSDTLKENSIEVEESVIEFCNENQNSNKMEVITSLPVNVVSSQENVTGEVTIEVHLAQNETVSPQNNNDNIPKDLNLAQNSTLIQVETGVLPESVQVKEIKTFDRVELVSVSQPIILENNMQPEKNKIDEPEYDADKIPDSICVSHLLVEQNKDHIQIQSTVPVNGVDPTRKVIPSEINVSPKKVVENSNDQTTIKDNQIISATENNGPSLNRIETNIVNQNISEIQQKIGDCPSGRKSESPLNTTDRPAMTNTDFYIQSNEKTQEIDFNSSNKPVLECNQVPGKRKSDAKRSSKKRKSHDKKVQNQRSLKKVGNLCYSKDEIKTMLDVLKQFS